MLEKLQWEEMTIFQHFGNCFKDIAETRGWVSKTCSSLTTTFEITEKAHVHGMF